MNYSPHIKDGPLTIAGSLAYPSTNTVEGATA